LQFCCVGEEKAPGKGCGAGSAALGAEDDGSSAARGRFRRRSGSVDERGAKES
jgi:hypothetical protein